MGVFFSGKAQEQHNLDFAASFTRNLRIVKGLNYEGKENYR